VVTDTIVFAYADIGIEANSPSTILHNIHVWNNLHEATPCCNGPGMHIGPGASYTRVTDSYIDNSWLNIVDPSNVQRSS
jgi:hypothetical protein